MTANVESSSRSDPIWTRSSITSCCCSDKSYRHVHCPCSSCNGRAVDRSTELRYWKESQVVFKSQSELDEFREPLPGCSFTESDLSDEEQQMDEDTEGMQFDVSNTESDVDEVESCGSFPRGRVEPCSSTVEPEEREPNSLKKLVLNAVLDALRIVKESGSSCQTSEDILDYGKTLLLASRDSENIDHEILLTLWPRN